MSAPNIPAATIAALEQSVAVLEELDPSVREIVLPAYMHSIAQTFLVGVVASVLISLCALYVKICTFFTFHIFYYHFRAVRNISIAESPENVSDSHRELSELSLSRLPTKELITQ